MVQDAHGAQIGQAWALLRQGKYQDAITGFQQILQENPNHLDAAYGLGLAQAEAGQREAARKTYERATELVNKALEAAPTEDRFEMLQRMISQRIHELGHK